MTQANEMTLTEVQSELRTISGTPYRDDADRLRRQALWKRLDFLTKSKADRQLSLDTVTEQFRQTFGG